MDGTTHKGEVKRRRKRTLFA